MGLLSVAGRCNKLAVQLLKLLCPLTERYDLRRTNESEVLQSMQACQSKSQKAAQSADKYELQTYLGIKEEYDILPSVVLERDFADLPVNHSCRVITEKVGMTT